MKIATVRRGRQVMDMYMNLVKSDEGHQEDFHIEVPDMEFRFVGNMEDLLTLLDLFDALREAMALSADEDN